MVLSLRLGKPHIIKWSGFIDEHTILIMFLLNTAFTISCKESLTKGVNFFSSPPFITNSLKLAIDHTMILRTDMPSVESPYKGHSWYMEAKNKKTLTNPRRTLPLENLLVVLKNKI